jgi:hypothetical protein
MTPLVPVAAAAGIGLLLALTRKKLPQVATGPGTIPGGGVLVHPPPIIVPHPVTGQPQVIQPPPQIIFPPSPPGGGTMQSISAPGGTIDQIIQQQLDAAGVGPGPNTAPPPTDTGLQDLPPPQVVSDGMGGLTTTQPVVPGDLGTQQFGSTIDDIIAQQMAQAGGSSVSGWNSQKRAARVGRAFGGGVVGRAFGGGVVGRAGYGW